LAKSGWSKLDIAILNEAGESGEGNSISFLPSPAFFLMGIFG